VVSRLFIQYSLRLRNEVTVELSGHNHGSDDQIMHVDRISGSSSLRMASGEKLKAHDEEETGAEPQRSREVPGTKRHAPSLIYAGMIPGRLPLHRPREPILYQNTRTNVDFSADTDNAFSPERSRI
jgi:hypothetical protein